MVARLRPTKFTKKGSPDGRRNNGRPKGSVNRVPRFLVDTIMSAGAKFGFDGKGKGGLEGYCMRLARDEPRAFAMLMSKIIPTQIKSSANTPRELVAAETIAQASQNYMDMVALMRSDPSLRMIAGPGHTLDDVEYEEH